ncbi:MULTISPECIES: hypothetical protein [Candidatus Accumulibacter]|uniref:hypothetical protein n=2 Tax=Betaproteobacteria incertae sedis TaxID=119066 RepID=UPI00145E15CA|nr:MULTISPECIES: hypothetical protein [Candidatus Accumulibacter]
MPGLLRQMGVANGRENRVMAENALHLGELDTIPRLLGHGRVSTTMRYFHLARTRLTGTTSTLELLTPS